MQKKQTILIVDDTKENIDVLMELLCEFDLITALDGQTALDIVNAEENIDLILLDIMMPEMNGFEVCKILKNSSKTKHIPIIFLSAKSKQEDTQRGFELGAVDYITKPFNPNELISRTNTHLKLRAYEKNLEKRVADEIAKNKLKEQMIYQQSKQAVPGELLMHIAYQWKQPLATLGSINLLNKLKLEADSSADNKELIKSVKKSEELIMFMSDTIETFKHFYQPSHVDKNFLISECILDVLSIIEATFYFDNIKIYIISHEEEETFGNRNEFSQVVFSILNNAREIFKIRGTKDPEIHIAIENKKISIRDNGGGIDEDLIDDIFLPFVSSHNRAGTGLYLSKEIVEKNSGVITASNTNDGAKFTIEFITWII
ncbi:hybrid sensor histidine kinase/response regulator [Candidatus Sulfurimonas baltica]|uniref:histidine kinase n=1 Tax=Candidatus Sulfurimonas baltica TaxID=2740404 RepID=A0A7S7LW39_9BACT|nr:hybrid sensor histidine kinase/response regulator [Candidatus Sulfurimonas baltica]QOY52402.1 hybrid sensor histidine kinase/response regulator [Candidatus Sulfurimonas baltica]